MTLRPPLAKQLDLQPHPEGGWYRETWRSPATFAPEGYDGPRSAATAIYFVLHPGEQSRWHVVRSDELWFWHSGGPLALRLGGNGQVPTEAAASETAAGGTRPGENATDLAESAATAAGAAPTVQTGDVLLGPDVLAGQRPQALVPGGVWQSAVPASGQPVFVSCVVAPGFDFADFRLA
jgi:predicted cupin superfamily sugar epimerase